MWRLYSKITKNRLIAKVLISIRSRVRVLEWGLGGADLLVLMGENYRERMIKRGVSPHRIVVSGYVLLDEIIKSELGQTQPKPLDNIPGLKQSKKKILLISQPLVEDEICSLKKYHSVIDTLVKNLSSEYQLIIKPHARENTKKYTKLIKEFPEKVILTSSEYNLGDLVKNTEIALTFHSTAGLTTLVYKKPLIVLNFIRFLHVNPLRDFGLTVDTIEKLRDFAQNPLKFTSSWNANYEENIRRYLYQLDGDAALRVARIILKIIDSSTSKS